MAFIVNSYCVNSLPVRQIKGPVMKHNIAADKSFATDCFQRVLISGGFVAGRQNMQSVLWSKAWKEESYQHFICFFKTENANTFDVLVFFYHNSNNYMFGGVWLFTFQGLFSSDFPKWMSRSFYSQLLRFRWTAFATITLVQYTTKQLVQDTKTKIVSHDCLLKKRIKGISFLSSVTGNQLHETWYKSAFKIECHCSRDENQTRNICDREILAVRSH